MSVSSSDLEAVGRKVALLRRRHEVPGIAVAVSDAEGPVWSCNFGTTRRSSDQEVGPRTLWSLQSQSKMYTATAVLVAVQEGLLELDAPVTGYLPSFSVHSVFETDPADRMTLRHLLSHTAGFTHEAPLGSNYRVGSSSFAAHCASIRHTWLRCPVGHHFEYSNLGIDLAAEILSTVTAASFPAYLRRQVLAPLGTIRATFDPRAVVRDDDRAEGHSPRHTRLPVRVPMLASGGLWASVEDACRYASFHLSHGGGLMAPGLLDEQYTVPSAPASRLGYGLGILSRTWDGLLVRGHSGGGFGFLSDTYWAPQHDVGVAVVTNSDDHPLQGQLVFEILKSLVKADPRPRAPSPRDAHTIDGDHAIPASLLGEYVSRGDRVTIRRDGDAVVLEEAEARHELRLVDREPLVLEDENREGYRFLPHENEPAAFLERQSDGYTRARNRLPALPRGATTRRFRIREFGRTFGLATLIVSRDAGQFTFASEPTVRVDQELPGLWFTAHGEVLDLTTSPPTYGNVELHAPPGT